MNPVIHAFEQLFQVALFGAQAAPNVRSSTANATTRRTKPLADRFKRPGWRPKGRSRE